MGGDEGCMYSTPPNVTSDTTFSLKSIYLIKKKDERG
jgi:hypothetical protein